MTIISGPFRSINGDRKFNVEWFTLFFSSFIGNGIFPNPSTNLQLLENGNMTTIVKSGRAWANGHFMYSDADVIIEHDIADGLLNRIDRIVVRLDFVTRKMTIEIKKGIFASSPVAPTLQRDSSAHELALADVYIGAGAIEITQANITDQRLNNSLCGIVHGTVDQVDTTTLYNQYLDFWQTWRQEQVHEFEQFQADSQLAFEQQFTDNQDAFDGQYQTNQQTFNTQQINNQDAFDLQIFTNQQSFDDWFATVQGVLSGDVAGNLQTLIQQNENSINDLAGVGRTTETVKGSYDEIKNHIDDKGNPHNITTEQIGAIPTAEKGQANGVATLGPDRKVPSEQINDDEFTKMKLIQTITTDTITHSVEVIIPSGYKKIIITGNNLLSSTSTSYQLSIRLNSDTAVSNSYGRYRITAGLGTTTADNSSTVDSGVDVFYRTGAANSYGSFVLELDLSLGYNLENVTGVLKAIEHGSSVNLHSITFFNRRIEYIGQTLQSVILKAGVSTSSIMGIGCNFELWGVK